MRKIEYIDATKLTLDQWLKVALSPASTLLSPARCFPSNDIEDEYLATVESREINEVKALLKFFLVPSANQMTQDFHRAIYTGMASRGGEKQSAIGNTEFYRRLMSDDLTWEGTSWLLDLLPRWPLKALAALDAYFFAHAQYFPDDWLFGQGNAAAVIRARFVTYSHAREIFFTLNSRQFECLVKSLYVEMGYDVELTAPGRDGGRDLIATRNEPGRKERLYIECKLWEANIGSPVVNRLFGVAQRDHATKGVLVCSSNFTKPAQKFCAPLDSMELIDHKMLVGMLNENLGTTWPDKIDRYTKED